MPRKISKKISPLPWPGGKRLLARKIVSLFPIHRCYVEAFAGGLKMLFEKDPSHVEVVNDIDNRLINFYQVIKICPEKFLLELQWDLVSRKLFENYRNELKSEETLDNVQKAVRFYYLIKTSFAGFGKDFGYSTTSKPKLNLDEVNQIVHQAHNRLKRVFIENIDYRDLIERYDREHTFWYLDPPYRCNTSKSYFRYFTDQDYIDLKDVLTRLKGKFILSLNVDPFLEKLFLGFNIDKIQTRYSIMKDTTKKVEELLIKNF